MTPEQIAFLRGQAAAWGIRLDGEALDRLARFFRLLGVWNRRVHLTGERDEDMLVRKHGLDALAPARYLPATGPAVDVGSGAGFPGIILACVRPDLEFVLVEARRRPVSFLREAVRDIPLPQARVLQIRAEEAATGELAGMAHLVIARALRVEVFLGVARPLLAPDGVAISMQTPAAHDRAVQTAHRLGMHLGDQFDYELPTGESRSLFVFASRRTAQPVS